MTFAEYMDLALYHPSFGYYSTHIPGPEDDFRTSPSLSPWFGRLLSKLLTQMRTTLASDDPFTVVEVGAGSGHLALASLEARLRRADTQRGPGGNERVSRATSNLLRWIIVERSEAVESRQRELLDDFPEVSWVRSLNDIDPVEGCIVANEVLDNFPVHVLEVTERGVQEVYVKVQGQDLAEELGPLSYPQLEMQAAHAVPHLQPGDRFEVNLAMSEFAREASATIKRGYLLVIDYGDEEPLLWINRPAGSMVSYVEGKLDLNVLTNPGERDITSHVNFSQLTRLMEEVGWRPNQLRTQRELLLELGAQEVGESIRDDERQATGGEAVRLMSERSALTTLYRAGGLGDLKVLSASRGP